MKPKRGLWIALTLLSVLASGCSSIRARTDVLPRQGWTVYPGPQQGVKDIDDAFNGRLRSPGWVQALLLPVFVVDLPIGAIFDTLALPYDLYRMNNPEEFARRK